MLLLKSWLSTMHTQKEGRDMAKGATNLFDKIQKEEKPTKPKRQAKPKAPKVEKAPEVMPELATPEAVDETVKQMVRDEMQADIKRLCEDAQRIGANHSKLARLAGYSGLASDLQALAEIGKQLGKKIESRPYWERA